ncbi:MAG TPA: hypothetical protein VGM75_27790 [Pseudonocardiaceae bacterium]
MMIPLPGNGTRPSRRAEARSCRVIALVPSRAHNTRSSSSPRTANELTSSAEFQ